MSNKDHKNKTETPESEAVKNEAKESAKPETSVEDLQKKIEQALKEKADVFAQLQRVSADYSNFQKRVPKQVADSVAYEKETIIRALLPALDNFEHALEKGKTENAEALLQGIKIVYDQVLGILKTLGVEQIQALDQVFDPSMHSAIMQKSVPGKEDNIILDDFAKGYTLNGRVIRPSRVAVNKISAQAPEMKPEQNDGQIDSKGQENC
jgi:molecular chaperone GrpE